MPAITSLDLSNAKLDVDHIAAIATSLQPTATDRLGHIKNTVMGAVSTIMAFNDRGSWSSGTSYSVKDLVRVTVSSVSSWYVAVVPHISGISFSTDIDTKWRLYQGVTSGDLLSFDITSRLGYAANFSGAVPQNLQSHLWAMNKSLSNAGCVGDGSDESAKITAILNSGATEVYIPDGVFVCKGIVVTSSTLRKIYGPGTLKLANGANTFLINFNGTKNLTVECTLDGNKLNQSGGANREPIMINILASSSGTNLLRCIIKNAYIGAAINNSGTYTTIDGCFIYDCGLVSGDCDAIFNGTTGISFANIINNHIDNCTDYAIACDTSYVSCSGNIISSCFAGIGALTRGRITNHKHFGNTISNCIRPFDFFNSATDSGPTNQFDNITIEDNDISGTAGPACISFSGNNATLKLISNLKIKNNRIYTEGNLKSAIFVSSASSNHNSDVEISGNKFFGDSVSVTDLYAVNINNTDYLNVFNNVYAGVDLGCAVSNSTGKFYGNEFRVVRDAYGLIVTSVLNISEEFKNIPRRAILAKDSSTLTIDVTFDNVGFGLFLSDSDTLPPGNTIYVDGMTIKNSSPNSLYVDGAPPHTLIFNSEPVQVSQLTYNVLQPGWNIALGSPPSVGTWSAGQKYYNVRPTVGQSKGGYCTVSGTPGTWVSEGNL